MKRSGIIIILAVLFLCTNVAGDEVWLKNGDKISGKITAEGKEKVTIETKYGELTIPRGEIKRIEMTASLSPEYIEKATALAKRYRQLAGWCRENGFTEKAKRHISEAEKLEKEIAAANVETKPLGPPLDFRVFDAVWETVRDQFYDPNFHGVDWNAMYFKYEPKAKKARDQFELYDVCNRMMTELKASHCYLMAPYVWKSHMGNEFRARKTMQAGIEIQRRKGKYYVRTTYEGGPAETAGVLVGDEVITVNGKPISVSPVCVLKDGISTNDVALFTLKTGDGKPVTLGLRSGPDELIHDLKITPEKTSMVESARNSVTVIEKGTRKLGYIHLWHYMNMRMVRILEDAVKGELADCDGLILDIRGRGGNPRVIRGVMRVFTSGRWNKPAVLVVDEETSSAKEIFAYMWKKRDLGPVVGLRTAGHVLGCGFTEMPDESMLMVARTDVQHSTDGIRLEGKGVDVDVKVEKSFEYCRGKHPILEKAGEVLHDKIEGKAVIKRWHLLMACERKRPRAA